MLFALQNSSAKLAQILPSEWLIYDEMNRGHRNATVRCCSLVTAITVAVFGGSALSESPILRETGKDV